MAKDNSFIKIQGCYILNNDILWEFIRWIPKNYFNFLILILFIEKYASIYWIF